MAKIKMYNVLGKEIGDISLNSEIFGIEPHQQSMFDVVLSERAAARTGNHKTKGRSDVSGGGKKPWRQKGTGRARHGSIRSPIWRGGGIVGGPQPEKNYKIKINKKARLLAHKSAWTVKMNDIFVIDKIEFKTPSTRDFKVLLNNLKVGKKDKILFISDIDNFNTRRSSQNLQQVLTTTTDYLLVEDILGASKILVTKDLLEKIQGGLVK